MFEVENTLDFNPNLRMLHNSWHNFFDHCQSFSFHSATRHRANGDSMDARNRSSTVIPVRRHMGTLLAVSLLCRYLLWPHRDQGHLSRTTLSMDLNHCDRTGHHCVTALCDGPLPHSSGPTGTATVAAVASPAASGAAVQQ